MKFPLTLLAGLTAAVCLIACSEQAVDQEVSPSSVKKPNIIVILADDLGYGDLSSYGLKGIETPNIDQMAAQGMRFTDFYAGAAVCGPSRASLMTGMHMGHARVRGNKQEWPLLDSDITVAEVLKDAGYQTAVIGKWGLGDEGSTGTPDKQGFDFFYGFLNHVHAHNHFPQWLWRNQQKEQLNNNVQNIETKYSYFPAGVALLDGRNDYADHFIFNESLAYIDRAAAKKEPFFLYVTPVIPHANGDVNLIDWANNDGMEVPSYGEFADKHWPNPQKGFAAMLRILDNGVGQIIDKVKALGIEDNTIIIFTSDNGPHKEGGHIPEYFDSNGVYRGIKRDLYDGGVRVPMVVWAPGKVPANTVSPHVGYFADFINTFADLANTELPSTTKFDGLSFAPVLQGKTEQQKQHDYIYWESYVRKGAQAARMGKWKAHRIPIFTGDIELFDLSIDPSESINIAAQHPELVAQFASIFKQAHTPDPDWAVKPAKTKVGQVH